MRSVERNRRVSAAEESDISDASSAQPANPDDDNDAQSTSASAVETDAVGRADQNLRELPEMTAMLGSVVWLMSQSPAHRHFFLNDLEWLVAPALRARQFRIFRRNGVPIAYASWALLDEEREERLKSGEVRLAPAEWRCGDRLWLYDIVAPFGGAEEILKELRENTFPEQAIRAVQVAPDGKGRVTVEYPPARAAAKATTDS